MIPVDHFARVVVPYRGMQGSFDCVSATDILQGTAQQEMLENKIVLVGTTAPGLFDMRATPVSEVFPGVEVHANLVSGMLKGLTLRKPEFVRGYEIILLTVSGLIMMAAGTFLSPFHASIFGVLMIGNTRSAWRISAGRKVLFTGCIRSFCDSDDVYASHVLWILR